MNIPAQGLSFGDARSRGGTATVMLEMSAPEGDVGDYDRRNLLIYAELLDADQAGADWHAGSLEILGVDPVADPDLARRCWESHLIRARWIVGDGLGAALVAFGERSLPGRTKTDD